MAALPKVVEEIVSGVVGGFRIFPFYVGIVDGSWPVTRIVFPFGTA
jgi:hypothetical protein